MAVKTNPIASHGRSLRTSYTACPAVTSTLPSNPVSKAEIANFQINWLVKMETTAERTAATESELRIGTPGVGRVLGWWWGNSAGGGEAGQRGLGPLRLAPPSIKPPP